MLYQTACIFDGQYVYKYEAVLWTLENLRKTIFWYKMIPFSLRELKFSGNMYFSYTERLALAKVEMKKYFCHTKTIRKQHCSNLSYILLLGKVFSRMII